MPLFKRRNRFLDACNNVINNEKLYNSIVGLQNDLIVFTNSEPKVIAVVSPLVRLNSSLMAKTIAEVYAHSNKKTLLIDLDMRMPTMDKLFKLEDTKSILDIASDDVKSVVNKINDNLDVIVARVETFNANFLISDEFKECLSSLKENYKHIIVTLPPVLENQDILLVKEHLDAVLLVAKKDETTILSIESSVKFMKDSNINLVGTVFIK